MTVKERPDGSKEQKGICESCSTLCIVHYVRGWWLCQPCHYRATGGV